MCFDLTHAPVATAARAAAAGLVSMSTRPDPEGSGTVEIAIVGIVSGLSALLKPVVSDEKKSCGGTFLIFFAFCCPQAQHSAAQRSQSPHKQQSKYAPIRARQRKQALTELAGARMSWSFCIARCVLKTNGETAIFPAYQSSLAGVMLPGHCSFSPSFLFRPCMRRPGCLRGPWELLAFASRQFAPKTVGHSVRFIRSHFGRFLLVSGRNGRRKPPAERSVLCVIRRVYSIPVRFYCFVPLNNERTPGILYGVT